MPVISVVIPVYNAASLQTLVNAILTAVPDHPEIILIDDCSPQHAGYADELQQLSYPQLRYFRTDRNIGQDKATALGISMANGEYIITMDDDLEFPATEIHQLLRLVSQQKILIGYGMPTRPKNSWFRVSTRYLYYFVINRMNYPVFSSFRILHHSLRPVVSAAHEQAHFCLDKLLLTHTSQVGHTPVRYHPKDSSRYSAYRLFRKSLLFFRYRP